MAKRYVSVSDSLDAVTFRDGGYVKTLNIQFEARPLRHDS